jgi:hypothetical protein
MVDECQLEFGQNGHMLFNRQAVCLSWASKARESPLGYLAGKRGQRQLPRIW